MFYVQEFLDHLAEIHHQPKTIRDYRYLLNRLVSFCSQQQVADITAVTEGMIRDFLKSVSNGEPNRKSAYIKICRLRKYSRFLEDEGYTFLPPEIEQPVHAPLSASRVPSDGERMEHGLSRIRASTSRSPRKARPAFPLLRRREDTTPTARLLRRRSRSWCRRRRDTLPEDRAFPAECACVPSCTARRESYFNLSIIVS